MFTWKTETPNQRRQDNSLRENIIYKHLCNKLTKYPGLGSMMITKGEQHLEGREE